MSVKDENFPRAQGVLRGKVSFRTKHDNPISSFCPVCQTHGALRPTQKSARDSESLQQFSHVFLRKAIWVSLVFGRPCHHQLFTFSSPSLSDLGRCGYPRLGLGSRKPVGQLSSAWLEPPPSPTPSIWVKGICVIFPGWF